MVEDGTLPVVDWAILSLVASDRWTATTEATLTSNLDALLIRTGTRGPRKAVCDIRRWLRLGAGNNCSVRLSAPRPHLWNCKVQARRHELLLFQALCISQQRISLDVARIFITGSSDGLGQLAARILAEQRHEVVLHARDATRAGEALAAVPGATDVLYGDLSSLVETRGLAERANVTGPFDAVIHNAAVGFREKRRIETVDGLAHVFAVNTLAPYVLTALMHRPRRLIYISSELHRKGDASLDDLNWQRRPWHGLQAYRDSKLHDVLLAFAVARRWPGVISHALEPGWMPTKMGGAHATGDLDAGSRTQAWLAVSDEPAALESGGYWHHLRLSRPSGATRDADRQDRLLAECTRLSGVELPHG